MYQRLIFVGSILTCAVESLPGIFGTKAVLITDLTLLIQIVAFILVFGALAYSSKRKYKVHGFIMGVAVLLHFITFVASMGPSFVVFFTFFVAETFQSGVEAIWVHVFSGVISLILGFFLVLSWIPNASSIKPCFRRKRMMFATLVLWAISLVFGIVAYIFFYV